MTSDELRQRFVGEIETRGREDKYIDGIEERELLQIAIAHGFTTEQARTFLVQICQERGFVIEAAVVQRIRDAIRQRLDRWGRLSRSGFEHVLNEARPAVAGTTRTEHDLQRLVLETIEDTARTRRGWFGDWFRRQKRAAGIA